MRKVLFVCHGNICRSPMAEFVLKDMVRKHGWADQFDIHSAATSTEELGNPVHHGTRKKLAQVGISCSGKYARQLTSADYNRFDLLIGMDVANLRNMNRMLGGDPKHKLCLLLDFTDRPGNIADPWYTGNFDETYQDILEGCQGLLAHLQKTGAVQ